MPNIAVERLTATPHVRTMLSRILREAERLAVQNGRTLIVLDTATDGGAAGLYEQLGYTRAGEISDYALKPHGGLSGTLLYWKRIGVQQLP